MKRFALIAAVLLLSACTDEKGATRALSGEGFHDIKITGWRLFGCASGRDSSDTFKTGFEAVGPTGVRVTGVVCGGWLKGSTVRFD